MTSANPSPRAPATLWRPVRRVVLLHRRRLALAFVVLAALALSAAVRPAPSPTATALVAASDLPAGTRLDAGDLVAHTYAQGSEPPYAVTDPAALVGRVLTVGVRGGEPLGVHRLAGGEQRTAAPGLTTVPVRIVDGASLLSPGDVIDLVAAGRDGDAVTVARSLPVIGEAEPGTGDSGGLTGGSANVRGAAGDLVLVGVPAVQVEGVIGASSAGFLYFTFSP